MDDAGSLDLVVSCDESVLTGVAGFLDGVLALVPFFSPGVLFLTVVLVLVFAVSPEAVFLTTFLELVEVGVVFVLAGGVVVASPDVPLSGFCGADFVVEVLVVVFVNIVFVVFVVLNDLALPGFDVLGVVLLAVGGVCFLARKGRQRTRKFLSQNE